MQTVSRLALAAPAAPAFTLPASGTQFLPVTGSISDRLFVTYRADARRLAALVPRPFTLDVHEGYGFVSVCAVEILGMSIGGAPRLLSFDNREFLYRIAVRLHGESTFITLRSDVSSRVLAVLGRYFSHYRPHHARVWLFREGGRVRMECTTKTGAGDAVLDVDTEATPAVHTSVFDTHEEATRFLLGMAFSADVQKGRVRVQPIDHSPWHPRFVRARAARFAYVDALERALGTPFVHDSTLATRDVHQSWRAARWL